MEEAKQADLIEETQTNQKEQEESKELPVVSPSPSLISLVEADYSGLLDLKMKHRVSIAPMVDVTNPHFRFFMRLLSKHVTLWTEMLHENAILMNKSGAESFLYYNPVEKPVVLQVGGNTPSKIAQCAQIAQKLGYDEINLNCGCPSPRVTCGSFGACLMTEPDLVYEICKAVKEAAPGFPITVKHRLGVDENDSYEFTKKFLEKVSQAGVSHFQVHARKAFLKGLNPAENRSVPPLKYDWVLKLKKEFPDLDFTINGGFKSIQDMQEILKEENKLLGVMVGRLAMECPWVISDFDRVFFGKENQGFSRREILKHYGEYGDFIQEKTKRTIALPILIKPIINLFHGESASNKFRGFLSDHKNYPKKGEPKGFSTLLRDAVKLYDKFNSEALDRRPPKL